jgi:hypothetical protein
MSHDEVKRYILGSVGTKVELVFASKRDNKNIAAQLFRMSKGTEVEFAPEINNKRDRSSREGERGRERE